MPQSEQQRTVGYPSQSKEMENAVVTLDPDSANHHLILSEDGKQVRNEGNERKEMENTVDVTLDPDSANHHLTLSEDGKQVRNEGIESKEMENLPEDKLKNLQQRDAVDVTLDSDSANHHLILSEDGKQVRNGGNDRYLPHKPNRFDTLPYVLGKEGFSSGRFYYEVQTEGKTGWTIGVAKESIDRKGLIYLCPEHGYWTLGLYGEQYKANEMSPVLLNVKEGPNKVGVFVDFEAREVSFYDIKARTLIYSFTDCNFTERSWTSILCFIHYPSKLFPFLSPGDNQSGTNSDPLVITPVNHKDSSKELSS